MILEMEVRAKVEPSANYAQVTQGIDRGNTPSSQCFETVSCQREMYVHSSRKLAKPATSSISVQLANWVSLTLSPNMVTSTPSAESSAEGEVSNKYGGAAKEGDIYRK